MATVDDKKIRSEERRVGNSRRQENYIFYGGSV